MTLSEFSKEFDILYNNIMSNQAPGLSEWEKSVFLTNAQLEILKNYFNPAGNKYQQGFDDSSKRQIDFSNVIETKKLDVYVPSQTYVKIDNRSYCYDSHGFNFIVMSFQELQLLYQLIIKHT